MQLFDVEGFTDDRGCSACACTPAVTCSGGSVVAWDSNDCSPFNDDDPAIGAACTNISAQFDNGFASLATTVPTASGCAGRGGGRAAPRSADAARDDHCAVFTAHDGLEAIERLRGMPKPIDVDVFLSTIRELTIPWVTAVGACASGFVG